MYSCEPLPPFDTFRTYDTTPKNEIINSKSRHYLVFTFEANDTLQETGWRIFTTGAEEERS